MDWELQPETSGTAPSEIHIPKNCRAKWAALRLRWVGIWVIYDIAQERDPSTMGRDSGPLSRFERLTI